MYRLGVDTSLISALDDGLARPWLRRGLGVMCCFHLNQSEIIRRCAIIYRR
jgi:hypothetical protein